MCTLYMQRPADDLLWPLQFCKAKLSFSLPISLPQEEAAKVFCFSSKGCQVAVPRLSMRFLLQRGCCCIITVI